MFIARFIRSPSSVHASSISRWRPASAAQILAYYWVQIVENLIKCLKRFGNSLSFAAKEVAFWPGGLISLNRHSALSIWLPEHQRIASKLRVSTLTVFPSQPGIDLINLVNGVPSANYPSHASESNLVWRCPYSTFSFPNSLSLSIKLQQCIL
mgnify:CR=1 FL=1